MTVKLRRVSDLVIEHRPSGRRKPEHTCRCEILPYPHRSSSVPGCYGDLVCHHGTPQFGHPAYEGRCSECDREEYRDILFDLWHEEHGLY